MLNAKVRIVFQMDAIETFIFPCLDSCKVNNGGCGAYATCSKCESSGTVICTCKKGYTNVGTDKDVKCEGY